MTIPPGPPILTTQKRVLEITLPADLDLVKLAEALHASVMDDDDVAQALAYVLSEGLERRGFFVGKIVGLARAEARITYREVKP